MYNRGDSPKVCIRCGEGFRSSNGGAKYCSLKCRVLAGCREVEGAGGSGGKCLVYLGGERIIVAGKGVGVARILWEAAGGGLRSGRVLSRVCSTDGCICPEHRKVVDRGKVGGGGGDVGVWKKDGRTVLTLEQVRDIRLWRERGAKWLGEKHGVSAQTVRNVLDGRTWKGIT